MPAIRENDGPESWSGGTGGSYLDSHSLKVIKGINQPGNVTADPQLGRKHVDLERGAITVVVRRIAVDESVKEKRVERHPPVLGRRMELVIWPFAPVLQRRGCRLVLVEVVCLILGNIWKSECRCCKKSEKERLE